MRCAFGGPDEDKHFAMVWLGVLAVLCLISTLFALVTFLLDTERYKNSVNFLPFHSATNQFLCKACGSFPHLNFTPRFLYPEKCVVFLNLSYLLLAMGYIVRLSAGAIKHITCSD